MMCDHINKASEYLHCFDAPGYEIYLCGCGALINLQDRKNFTHPCHPMTAGEICDMMDDIFRVEMSGIIDAAEKIQRAAVKLRDVVKS